MPSMTVRIRQKSLFNCSLKAADFSEEPRDELARNAICPSHYMAAAEMYRATGDKRYLELAEGLIAIRDEVKNGEDHTQKRNIPSPPYVQGNT